MIKRIARAKQALFLRITFLVLIVVIFNNSISLFGRFRTNLVVDQQEGQSGASTHSGGFNVSQKPVSTKKKEKKKPVNAHRLKANKSVENEQNKQFAVQEASALTDWKVTSTADFLTNLVQIEQLVVGGEKDKDTQKKFKEGFEQQRNRFKKAIKKAEKQQDLAPITTPFSSILKSYKVALPYLDHLCEEQNLSASKYKQVVSDLVSQIYVNISAKGQMLKTGGQEIQEIVLTEKDCKDLVDHVVLQKPLPELATLLSDKSSQELNTVNNKLQQSLNLEIEATKTKLSLQEQQKQKHELEALKKKLEEREVAQKEQSHLMVQLKTEKNVLEERIHQQQKNIAALSEQLNSATDKIKDISHEKVSLQIDLQNQKQQTTSAKNLATTNAEKLHSAEMKVQSNEQSLKSAFADKLSSQIKSKELEMEKMLLSRKNTELSEALESKTREIGALQDKIKQNAENLDQTRAESRSLREQIEKLHADATILQDKIRMLTKDLQNRTQENISAQIKLNYALQEREQLETKLRAFRCERLALAQEKKQLKMEIMNQVGQMKETNQNIQNLEQKQNKLKTKVSQLTQRISEVNATPSDQKSLQEENQKIKQKMSALDDKLNQTQVALEKSKLARDGIIERLKTLENTESSKAEDLKRVEKNCEDATSRIKVLSQNVKDKTATLSQQLSQKTKVEDLLSNQVAMAQEKNKQINSLEGLAKAGDAKINTLQDTNENLKRTAASLAQEVKNIESQAPGASNVSIPMAAPSLPAAPALKQFRNNLNRPTSIGVLLPNKPKEIAGTE